MDVKSPISYAAWPQFAEDEIAAVTSVLKSGCVNYWTGDNIKAFEKEYAQYLGVNHTIALANGTVALELALYTLEIGPGDEVIVPSRTFIATASSVVARGATPICADVDINTQNITAETIKPLLTANTKAIIVVHLAGMPCEMDAILKLAEQHQLKVIEDCAQAHGAFYKGHPVGSLGDMATFSFCQDKILSTGGEGGLLVVQEEALWMRAWSYKDHGKDFQRVHATDHPPGFRWFHSSFGTNWRMTEMQAAIGRLQLQKLPQWVETRRQHAAQLDDFLSRYKSVRFTDSAVHIQHAYYKYYFFVPESQRQTVLDALNEQGVAAISGSCPEIYLEAAFSGTAFQPSARLPNAQHLGETSIMLQVHPTLTADHIQQYCVCLEHALQKAGVA